MTKVAGKRTSIGLVAASLLVATCSFSGCSDAQPAPPPQTLPTTATGADPINFRDLAIVRELGAEAKSVLTDAAIRQAFELPTPRSASLPRPNDERPRGGVELYTAAAPAVVIVRTDMGHGTGFLVSPDGFIVTNHHVVELGLRQRAQGSYAMVHVGAMSSQGVMQLQGESVDADLYKIDVVNDLALLKLRRAPGAPPVPFIKLSAVAPRPGLDCAIVGHPSSGMLWTFRPCQVASIGDFPKDMVNLVLSRLAATGQDRAQIETFVRNQPPRRIMLTSAQANPGDSGGPVVSKDGALIGVTFAGPGEAAEDKFTYHVHLDEVRRFTAQPPARPMFLVPSPWSFGRRVVFRDLDRDGRADVLLGGGEQADVLLFDLDNDTSPTLLASDQSIARLINERKWDFEFGIDVRGSGYNSFYDTDNDGRIDLILMTETDTQAATSSFVLGSDGQWRLQPAAGQRITAPELLRNPQLAAKLGVLLRALK
jgi:serine protease Do